MSRGVRASLGVLWLGALVACGGGGGSSESAAPAAAPAPAPIAAAPSPSPSPAPEVAGVSATDAARFLAQATSGPTADSIAQVSQVGYAAWLEGQFALPAKSHRAFVSAIASDGTALTPAHFRESWWSQVIAGDDQLRQRVAFALSEIFVVSFADPALASRPRGMAGYYDTLAAHAFGNYRDLLEAVATHPMMGVYLSALRNRKEDAATGRHPDQNFAREVMQLFSIGLHELNSDGTLQGGVATETYSTADVEGLAKVFTGWSWYAGPNLADRTDRRFEGLDAHPDREWRPMQAYAKFHSSSEKTFLGTTIPAGSSTAEADMKVALDRLFAHPNVGPFFGRQLIQRLVTSNPSPAYVGRVAGAFNDNGSGVRGDMKAVVRAVLLDPEARTYPPSNTAFGKPREPVLRLAHFMRAFNARSTSGRFIGIDVSEASSQLYQQPLNAPSVFNFFRPNYVPPNSAAAGAGLVAPEWQIANEVTLAHYVNYIRAWLVPLATRDVQQDYTAELALAHDPGALVDRLNLLLMSGQMSSAHRQLIIGAVNGRSLPEPTETNAAQVKAARRDRVCIAILLTMASPDYVVQK